MSSESFLAMLGDSPKKQEREAAPEKQNKRVSALADAYDFMLAKKEHSETTQKTYLHIIERPPNGVDVVAAAKSYLLSLKEAELAQALDDLTLQFPVSTSPAKINIVDEFTSLDEMGQYKFFCSVRDMFDEEDWATLVDKE